MLQKVLLNHSEVKDSDYSERVLRFYLRCMQFTGPLMAKGVEDTLMYTFNRFVGHNEVGDSPEYFGLTTAEFHSKMIQRQCQTPLAMNATSTHDTKRGEDVRMRLNVLPDLADEWIDIVEQWRALNKESKNNDAPDSNDEYFIYQIVVGAYPMQDEDSFSSRIEEYLTKALREAKLHSDWATPNEEYEEATKGFVRELLNPKKNFFNSFISFQSRISDYGIVNSLSQVLLKFTCPGVPDNYQGTSSWDLSLVDPDNRRPVDYEQRKQWLDELVKKSKSENFLSELWNERHDSRIKLWLVHTLLLCRSQHTEIFTQGLYLPIKTQGKYKDHIVAFARIYADTWLITVIPLYTGRLSQVQKKEVNKLNWRDTALLLPEGTPNSWEDLITHQQGTAKDKIEINEIFKEIPIALLKFEKKKKDRNAGLLMPLFSLPSPFGIGDVGKEAKRFVEFLSLSKQTYWQLLPLNPTMEESGHSPYSSFSSMAGNVLMISPESLAEQHLLTTEQLKEHYLPALEKINYSEVCNHKMALLEAAWLNYKGRISDKSDLNSFLTKEKYWLDDFALYVVLKNHFQQEPWHEWPPEFRLRQQSVLESFSKEHEDQLLKVKWFQLQFFKQWQDLKKYCLVHGIKLFGDLPFYVSYDSVDAWAHSEFFSLDDSGKITDVAGVPPDYFNSNGQLWGMPVFNWEALKNKNYNWWIQRIRKNLELYDVLRFDHFRAFIDFWKVSINETTAINGKWEMGPGSDFFQKLKHEFPDMPFIAEDLGDVSPAVFQLRDEYNLPGMKILQYAFDEQMPESIFIPHHYNANCVVYTGTHDNNTTRGWFREEVTREDRKRIENYLGHKVNEKTVCDAMIRLAYSSVAKLAIVPMQDILNLDEHSRINIPSTLEENWNWRMKDASLGFEVMKKLSGWVTTYGR